MSGQWKPFGDEPMDIEKEYHILPMPPLPPEAWEFIAEMQAAAQELTGMNEPIIGKKLKKKKILTNPKLRDMLISVNRR